MRSAATQHEGRERHLPRSPAGVRAAGRRSTRQRDAASPDRTPTARGKVRNEVSRGGRMGVQVADEPRLAGVEQQLLAAPTTRSRSAAAPGPGRRVGARPTVSRSSSVIAARPSRHAWSRRARERDALGRGHRPDEVAVPQRVAADEPVGAGERAARQGGRASRPASVGGAATPAGATTRRRASGGPPTSRTGPTRRAGLPRGARRLSTAGEAVEQDVGEVVPLGEERGEARRRGRHGPILGRCVKRRVRGAGRAPAPRRARSRVPRRSPPAAALCRGP